MSRGNPPPADNRGNMAPDNRTSQWVERNRFVSQDIYFNDELKWLPNFYFFLRVDPPSRLKPEEDDETPRSPSPEETSRLSSSFVPKKIPDRRADLDLRLAQPTRFEPSKDSYRSSSSDPRHLRTEPVVIPTTSQQQYRSSADTFSTGRDRDYRFDRPNSSDRTHFDDRRASHHSSGIAGISRLPPETGAGASSNSGRRESRFDLYGSEATFAPAPISSRPEERNRIDDSSHRPGHWNNQQATRDQHRDRMARPPDRDHQFQRHGDGFPNSADAPRHHHQQQHNWNTPSTTSNPAYARSSTSRWGPPTEHKAPSPHQVPPPPSSNMHDSRLQNNGKPFVSSPANHLANPTNSAWAHQDSSAGKSHWDSTPANSGRNPHAAGKPPVPQGVGWLPPPFPATQNVPNAAQPSSSSSQVSSFPAIPNYSNSAAANRREDPRLVSRPKPPSSSTSSGSNRPGPADRAPSSSTASSSRPVESRDNKRRSSPVRNAHTSSNSSTGSSLAYQKNVKPAGSNVTKPPAVTEVKEDKSRPEDTFVSPLSGLYSGSSKTGQTGRGYGVQNYKIPKKKPAIPPPKPVDSGTSTISQAFIPPANQTEEAKTEDPVDDDCGRLTIAEDAEEPPIPMDVLETYLKKALPSSDAEKVLERIKTTTKGTVDKENPTDSTSSSTQEGKLQAVPDGGSGSTTVDRAVPSPPADATVTSSGDVFPSASEEDGQSTSQSNPIVEKRGRGRPRKTPLELKRLKEDLTEQMKGSVEPGTRRSRSQTATQSASQASTEHPKGMRGRKRKTPTTYFEDSQDDADDGEPSVIEIDSMDTSSTSELNTTVELEPAEKGVPNKAEVGKKKVTKKGPAKQKKEPSPDGVSKAKKKKVPPPTRLSLRGRPSMYENSEPSDALVQDDTEQSEIPASGDHYFQCKECSFLGQKIVHHYVNEHFGSEIPYIAVPESAWDAIIADDQLEVPACQRISTDSMDLSWIPTRANYLTPVLCKLCPYSSYKRSELLEHVMVHELPNDCKYRCLLCSKVETNFFDIYDHVASHTGEYRFKCNYCEFKVNEHCRVTIFYCRILKIFFFFVFIFTERLANWHQAAYEQST